MAQLRPISILLVWLVLAVQPTAFGRQAPVPTEELEKRIPELMAAARIPGLSIALIRDGRVAWHRGFGLANAETRAPVTDNTIFEAASLSKPVFAYAVLKLADRGLLDLDAPLSRYLPEPYISGDDRIDRITARIVLDHTTGFPNWRPRGQPLKIFFVPGEKFSYSGEGYVYLQKAVERITGRPLNDSMKETVFDPLGMSASSYVWREDYDRLSATGHNLFGGVVEKRKPSQANAAASLHTTALDFARLVIAVMNGTGLDARSSGMMLTPQSKVDERCTNCTDRPDFHPSASLSWGLGWGLEKTGSGSYFWHWGDNGVFRCFVMASRETRSGVAVFTDSENGLAVAGEITRLALGGEHPSIAWLRYDQYDAPAMKFVLTALDEGAASAISRYRKMEGSAGYPIPKEEDVNRLGYAFLRMKKVDDAVRLFDWNVELYPKSYNVYDSLAEALATRGDTERAIQNYKKSLELNPDNTNARERLKDLIR